MPHHLNRHSQGASWRKELQKLNSLNQKTKQERKKKQNKRKAEIYVKASTPHLEPASDQNASVGADLTLLQVVPEPPPALAALWASPEAPVHQGDQHSCPFSTDSASSIKEVVLVSPVQTGAWEHHFQPWEAEASVCSACYKALFFLPYLAATHTGSSIIPSKAHLSCNLS